MPRDLSVDRVLSTRVICECAMPDREGNIAMNTRHLLITLLVATAPAIAGTHATASQGGTITFNGFLSQPASTAVAFDTGAPSVLAQSKQVMSLGEARTKLSSNVLDYFATYAPKDAQFVSVTYK